MAVNSFNAQNPPVTTKGDLFTFSTIPTRLGVGSNNQTLLADSAQATGIKWGSSPQSLMTTTGDVLYASSANTPARLGIGTTGQVLTVSGGVPAWATPGGAALVGCSITATGTQSISSSTWTALTYNSESFDTDGFHDNTTNNTRITIPTTTTTTPTTTTTTTTHNTQHTKTNTQQHATNH